MSKHRAPQPPVSIDAALQRAFLAFRQQRPKEAERFARQALELDQNHVPATQALAQALLMQSRQDEAINLLQTVARWSPDPATETLLARALVAAGRDDEAFEQLRRTMARRPPFPLAFLELGDRLGELGRFDEAIAVFEEGLSLTPEAAVLRMGLGYLYLKRNERSKARQLFLLVHEASPQRHDATVALAKVAALQGDYEAAASLYRRVLALRPQDSVARIDLAKCLLELGERSAGEANLRQAARTGPHVAGLAALALAATPRGRLFLRPSAATRFLLGEGA